MGKRKATVINCHELGIRKAPWITEIAEEIVETIKAGEVVEIASDKTFYSWDDKEFRKVKPLAEQLGMQSLIALRLCRSCL